MMDDILEGEFDDEESDQVLDQVLDEIGLDVSAKVRDTVCVSGKEKKSALTCLCCCFVPFRFFSTAVCQGALNSPTVCRHFCRGSPVTQAPRGVTTVLSVAIA